MAARVVRDKGALADLLQRQVRGLIVKNIMVQVRATEVVLWLTFNAETSRLDSWTAFAFR